MQNSTMPWLDTFPQPPDRSSLSTCKSVVTCQQPPPNVFSSKEREKSIKSCLTSTNMIRQISKVNECRLYSIKGRADIKNILLRSKAFSYVVCQKETTRRSLSSRCKIYRHLEEGSNTPFFDAFMWTGFVHSSISNLTLILITHKKKRQIGWVVFLRAIVTIPVHCKKKKSFK